MSRLRIGPDGIAGVAGVLALVLFAAFAGGNALNQVSLWLVEAMLALSLMLVWGHGGMFSLGQTALYGLGAYAYGVVAVNLASSGWFFWAGLGAAGAIAVLTAALLGYFVFYGRVSTINVAVITLAGTLVLYEVFNNTADVRYHVGDARLGGFNGLVGIPPTRLAPGADALDDRGLFILIAAAAVLAALAVVVLRRRPFGRITRAVGCNERRAELLGYDVRRAKWGLFVAGGLLAGIAGGLFAAWGNFVAPTVYSLEPAVMVVIWLLVGGRTRVAGAFAGVFVVEGLTRLLGGGDGQYAPLYLGAILIGIVLVAPSGLLGLLDRAVGRLRRGPEPAPAGLALGELELPPSDRSVALAVEDVHKRFAGVAAVDGVDLRLAPRGVHCLIGPNGAGKSTLFALLTGAQRATSGRITLDGRDITRLSPHRRARLGIAVKLQAVSVFGDLTARENLWLSGYAATHSAAGADECADRLLRGLGLDGAAPAESLSHGQQQWLEIGMVTAQEPAVILLDEPTAGMSVEETRATAELVERLAQRAAVAIIEHDMAFVRLLDAPVTVLHLGRVHAQGGLAELERDEGILDIYLGRAHAPA